MKMICPKCGGNEFITTAHVMQDWKVDASGNYLETIMAAFRLTVIRIQITSGLVADAEVKL